MGLTPLMRMTLTRFVFASVLGCTALACGASALPQPETREPITVEQYDLWMEELSNWGRWGDDDELGAANLMTEAKRQEAAALVRTGTTVSLAHDLITEEAVDAARLSKWRRGGGIRRLGRDTRGNLCVL